MGRSFSRLHHNMTWDDAYAVHNDYFARTEDLEDRVTALQEARDSLEQDVVSLLVRVSWLEEQLGVHQ
jgi:hypothetical protein